MVNGWGWQLIYLCAYRLQTSRFGWKAGQDGLRGHLFLSPDKTQGLVVFKGTSVSQLGLGGGSKDTPDSSKRDRLNVSVLLYI